MARFRCASPRATDVLAVALALVPAVAAAAGVADPRPAEVVTVALPPVEAGAVATALVTSDLQLRAGETASYRIEAAAGVRVFGPLAGPVDALPGESVALPLTYAIGSGRPAGRHEVARLVVTRSDGERWEAELWTQVNVRARLELAVLADPSVVEPGGSLRLSYVLTNRGNAADSVRLEWTLPAGWSVRPAVDAVVLAAGATVVGGARAEAPRGARTGSVHTMRLAATGRGGGANALTVVSVQAGGGERADLPAVLMLGAGAGGAGGAFRAFGVVAGDTRIEAAAAYNVRGVSRAVPLPEAGVPAFRLGVERPAWRAAIGEARLNALPMLGSGFAGYGAEGAWTRGTVTTTVAAFGLRPGSDLPDDRLLHVHARRATDRGLVGTTATIASRERLPGQPSLVAVGGGTYELPASSLHRLRVESGLMYVRPAPDSTAAVGPSFVAAYELTHPAGGVVARLRRVPSGGAAGEVLPDEAYLGARGRLPQAVSAFVWGVRTEGGGFLRSLRTDAASAGLDWAPGRARLSVSGTTRNTTGLWHGASATTQTLAAGAGYHHGQARIDLTAESGRAGVGADSARAFHAGRASVHWVAGSSWAWTTLAVRSGETPTTSYQLDVGGRLVHERANVSLGASATWGWGGMVGTAWASVGIAVTPELEVVAAGRVDQGPTASPAHVSIAVRRRFGLPVPARPAGAAYGRVFEDLDGDGLAGPGEPGMPGVTVRLGALRAVSGDDGRWTIREATSQAGVPTIDVASLPPGLLPHGTGAPAAAGSAAAGRTDLAVVRVATLVVDVFEDADGSGTRGAAERGVAGATVMVEDASGQRRWAQADLAGRATFAGMAPGLHGVTVAIPAGGPRPASERVDPVTLTPGGEATMEVPVESSERRIRFGAQN